jgi:hypothetical protein
MRGNIAMTKKTYSKPEVLRYRLRPEDSVVAACNTEASDPNCVIMKDLPS